MLATKSVSILEELPFAEGFWGRIRGLIEPEHRISVISDISM
jgi:hypothetical protein